MLDVVAGYTKYIRMEPLTISIYECCTASSMVCMKLQSQHKKPIDSFESAGSCVYAFFISLKELGSEQVNEVY